MNQEKKRFSLLPPRARALRFASAPALVLCLPALLWLVGCASNTPAPVDGWGESGKSSRFGAQGASSHLVRKGDTLYSIAWHYALDYHQLAGWNGIDASYRIYPGQVLQLKEPPAGTVTVAAKAPVAKKTTPKAKTQPKPKPKPESKPKPTAATATAQKQPPQKAPTVAKTAPKAKAPAVAKAAPKAKAPAVAKTAPKAKAPAVAKTAPKAKAPAVASGDGLKWVWPTRGKVIQKFHQGDRTRQGIRVAGTVGQPVVAAESGKVVYTGSGLPGYGKLIIVKHNKNYLSAYGFNRKLLVKDGDQVSKGARIAEMGQSTDGKTLLHFEIRRRDKPVDPLKRLPRR